MRSNILFFLAGLAAMVSSVQARPDGERRMEHRERIAERHALRMQLADFPRSDSTRKTEGEGERCGEMPCRMSVDERRQLRRDIHDAGRDIYRRGPRGGD